MSSSSIFGLDHLQPEQLCYVHCNFCNTVLAVSVPCSSLFKIVTVRCGHCTNLLSVNMRALLQPPPPPPLPPPPPSQQSLPNHQLLPPSFTLPVRHDPQEEIPAAASMLLEHSILKAPAASSVSRAADHTTMTTSTRTTTVNRPPEKRQRVPSAYNRFIKDEIQRIKAGNPDITHREAFSTAAKNWAHFPHIHFGLMADQNMKKTNLRQQEGDDMIISDGFFGTANMGVTPY